MSVFCIGNTFITWETGVAAVCFFVLGIPLVQLNQSLVTLVEVFFSLNTQIVMNSYLTT